MLALAVSVSSYPSLISSRSAFRLAQASYLRLFRSTESSRFLAALSIRCEAVSSLPRSQTPFRVQHDTEIVVRLTGKKCLDPSDDH